MAYWKKILRLAWELKHFNVILQMEAFFFLSPYTWDYDCTQIVKTKDIQHGKWCPFARLFMRPLSGSGSSHWHMPFPSPAMSPFSDFIGCPQSHPFLSFRHSRSWGEGKQEEVRKMACCFSYGTNIYYKYHIVYTDAWAGPSVSQLTDPWAGGLTSDGFFVNLQVEDMGIFIL